MAANDLANSSSSSDRSDRLTLRDRDNAFDKRHTPYDHDSEESKHSPQMNGGSLSRREEKKPLIFSKTQAEVREAAGLAPKLSVWKKIAFGVGAMPYAMCNTVLGFYFSIFLLEVVILDPTYVLIIVFSGRVWDAITDPIVGYLTTWTRTRFGRLRPWMMMAALPGGLVYLFLWFVPPVFDEREPYWKFIYYLLFYFAFQALLTCIHVPYTSLTMHMSHDNKERDSATLYRMCFEVAGTLLGIGVYTVFFVSLVHNNENDCNDGDRQPDPAMRATFRYHALTLGILTFFFILTTFLGVREQQEEIRADKRIGFFKGLRETISFRPYLLLLLLELFSWLSVQFVQGNAALYVKYTVKLEDQYPYVIALLLFFAILWMPLWQYVIVKFGKKTAFFISMWILMFLNLSMLFADFYPYSVYPLVIIGAMGVSSAYLVPWSMLPDVVDEAALLRGVRREELFYAYFVFGNKFAGGVTLGISTAIYKIVGYDENKCTQPWIFPLTLKLLVSVPPIIFILISLIFLHYYPITEKSREKTKRLLAERRRSSGGSAYNPHAKSISISQWDKEKNTRIRAGSNEMTSKQQSTV